MRAYKYLLAFFSFIFLTVNVQAMMKRDPTREGYESVCIPGYIG